MENWRSVVRIPAMIQIFLSKIIICMSSDIQNFQVHRCGPGGSMRACHAAGPGSIPGSDKFPR